MVVSAKSATTMSDTSSPRFIKPPGSSCTDQDGARRRGLAALLVGKADEFPLAALVNEVQRLVAARLFKRHAVDRRGDAVLGVAFVLHLDAVEVLQLAFGGQLFQAVQDRLFGLVFFELLGGVFID